MDLNDIAILGVAGGVILTVSLIVIFGPRMGSRNRRPGAMAAGASSSIYIASDGGAGGGCSDGGGSC